MDNGIWLCATHAGAIDDDHEAFPEERLITLRTEHYARIREEQDATLTLDDAAFVLPFETVRHWPSTIGGQWLARPELDALAAKIVEGANATTLLLGAPGSGKSALLAKLVPLLEQRGVAVFALRLDGLPKDVRSEIDLGRWAGVFGTIPARLRREAGKRPVVFILDQLDQLSDLADRDTRRLDAVLQCMLAASEVDDVRIVGACRRFDFNHDARFRRLDAAAVDLPVLEVSQMQPLLQARGIDIRTLPQDVVEVLRVPQHLKVFVEMLEGRGDLLGSYHQMLEHAWAKSVSTDARRAAVHRLAEAVAREESAFVPSAWFDSHRRAMDELAAEGLVTHRGLSVGFSHQTLFDFARARAFVTDQEDLLEYVRKHQDSLFVRPVLWSAMHFMRAAGAPSYLRAVPALLADAGSRDHIRVLVAEFLGQAAFPTETERAWATSVLKDDSLRGRFLGSTGGNAGWFTRLGKRVVLGLMREHPGQVVVLLLAALAADEQAVMSLVAEAGWCEDPSRVDVIGLLLRSTKNWGATTDVFTRLTRAGHVAPYDAADFLQKAACEAPERAADLLVELVMSSQGDASGREAGRRALEFVVAFRSGDLPGLARTAPHSVLRLLSFLEVVTRPEHDFGSAEHRYAGSGALAYPQDGLVDLYNVLCLAAETLAASPSAFLAAGAPFLSRDSDAVHAVLARGFSSLPESHVDLAVEYLAGDPRRLFIAGRAHPDLATMELLKALRGRLNATHVDRLETSIFSLPASTADEGPPDYRLRNRRRWLEKKSRLLMALPEHHRSVRARQHASSFPADVKRPDPPEPMEFRQVDGPMTTDQMAAAEDEHLVRLFEELIDETEWKHPRHEMVGGSIEASRTLKELALREPARVAKLIDRLEPKRHERPVGHALEGLAEARWDFAAWTELVLSRDAVGFSSNEFRVRVVDAVRRRAADEDATDVRLVAMLERWLEDASESVEEEHADPDEHHRFGGPPARGDDAKPRAIVRSFGGGFLPEGSYRILAALAVALDCEGARDSDRWVRAVERHVARSRSTDRIWCWRALAPYLARLRFLVERPRATAFFRELFAKYPEVLASHGGALLLFSLARWAAEADRAAWCGALRDVDSSFSLQLAGEFLAASDVIGKAHEPADARLAACSEEEALGIVLYAADRWHDFDRRARATVLLLAGLARGDAVALAVLEAFDRRDVLPDDGTRRVLAAVLADSALADHLPTHFLGVIDRLLPEEPALALRAAEATIDAVESRRRAPTGWLEAGPALTSLALTLQRTDGFQAEGLRLFERLVRLDVYGVREAMVELDRRPGPARIRAQRS